MFQNVPAPGMPRAPLRRRRQLSLPPLDARRPLHGGHLPRRAKVPRWRPPVLEGGEHNRPHGGVHVELYKEIPVSAGLGGGSSDAAATLKGLNSLWQLDLSTDELSLFGATLGSDVPFFLHGGTAMVHGRGENVRVMPPTDLAWVIILVPAISLPEKTAELYARVTCEDYTRGALTRKLEARIRSKGDVPPQLLFNVFDNVALDAFPALAQYRDVLYSLGVREIHVAGSGPALYAPILRKEVGTAVQAILEYRYGWQAYLTSARTFDKSLT